MLFDALGNVYREWRDLETQEEFLVEDDIPFGQERAND